MEAKLRNSLYKIELHWIKIIPMVLCALSFIDTILSYFEVEGSIISYLNALLVWLFLYLSSFVFQFCRWHRMFLYYLLVEGCINCYDYEIGIPLDLKNMIVVQLALIMIFVSIGLYFHQHDKHPCRKDCNKTNSRMYKEINGKKEYITPYTKEQLDEMLEAYGIKLKRNKLYDAVYVANMCQADFLGKSVPTEEHLCKYVKDVVDDADAEEGYVFNRFYADYMFMNNPIDWDDVI